MTKHPRLPTAVLAAALAAFGVTAAHAQLSYVSSGGTFSTEFVNVAAAANGAVAFAGSEYGTPHFTANLNDGLYGNSNSWLAAPVGQVLSYEDLFVSAGVIFSAPATITSLAFGRDNTGGFTDRSSEEHRFFYSTDPIAGFNPLTATWNSLGVVFPDTSFRKLYTLSGGPIAGVTAVRVSTIAEGEYLDYSEYDPETDTFYDYYIPFSGQAIDELEVYSTTAIPEPSAFAALAGIVGLAFAAARRRRLG